MRKPSSAVLQYLLLCASVFVFFGGIFTKVFDFSLVSALTTVTLNNGALFVGDTENITVQHDLAAGEIGAYQWSNGGNLMSLNMPFNSGLNQEDFSGNNYDGTASFVGTVYDSNTANCKVGGCMSFSGISSGVSTPSINLTGTNQVTVEFWARIPSYPLGGNKMMVEFSNNTNNVNTGFDIFIGATDAGADNNIRIAHLGNAGWSIKTYDKNLVNDGQWHHWVGVFDKSLASGEVNLYIDGVLRTPTQIALDANNTNSFGNHPFYLAHRGEGSLYNEVVMDEVKIFPFVLSQAQITQNYNNGSAGVGGPTIITSGQTTLGQTWTLTMTAITSAGSVGSPITSNTLNVTSGVSLNGGVSTLSDDVDLTSTIPNLSGDNGAYRWTVDGSNLMRLNMPFNTGSSQTDFSGHSNTGTATNGAAYTTSGCKVGGCMSFDGNNDFVEFGDVTTLDGLSALSLTGWIKPTSYGPGIGGGDVESILSKTDLVSNPTSTIFVMFQGTGTENGFFCGVSTSGGQLALFVPAASSVPLNDWTHFTCTWASGGQLKLYLNGSFVTQTGGTVTGTINDSGSQLRIGSSNYVSEDFFAGQMDEISIFNRQLSPSQIALLYTNGNAGVGGPTIIQSEETAIGEVWNLTVTPISSAGSIGSALLSANTVTIVTPPVEGAADSEINIDVNDFLSFEIENFASGDEPAGDQPFGAGAQITDLTSTGNNDYAISGDFGTPVFTRLQTTTNSTDGYNVIAYASNLDGRTQTLLRSGGTPGSSADEISDTITRLASSQGANDTLTTSTDTGLAFRLHDANTSSILREADEDTQWGDDDTTNALWASFPLGSGAAQIIYDTATYSAPATTAYINWFVGISSTQRSGSYSGQVTFTASVN